MSPAREIEFDGIFGFRDLGGLATYAGRHVAWGRVYRSGELGRATPADLRKLRHVIGLRSELDVRDEAQIIRHGRGPADAFRYRNVPLSVESIDLRSESLHGLTNCGEVYMLMMKSEGFGGRLIECLRFIADTSNHPVVFHCSAGKDRSGVLTAVLLGVLGVVRGDIIGDYVLTASCMPAHLERMGRNPDDDAYLKSLPTYLHEAAPASMELFLSTMEREYGSIREYLLSCGAEPLLFETLERGLLEGE